MKMSVEYSTMPAAFFGARAMSAMTAFLGSDGSTSPNARPTSFSYCPTVPNEVPSNVGDSMRVISIRVMRACARLGAARTSTTAKRIASRTARRCVISLSSRLQDLAARRTPAARACQLCARAACDQKVLALVVRQVELSRERERVRREDVRHGTAPPRAGEDTGAEQAVHLVRSGGDASRRGLTRLGRFADGKRALVGDDAPRVRSVFARNPTRLERSVRGYSTDFCGGAEALDRPGSGQDHLDDPVIGDVVGHDFDRLVEGRFEPVRVVRRPCSRV